MSISIITTMLEEDKISFSSEDDKAQFVGALHATVEMHERDIGDIATSHQKEIERIHANYGGDAVFHLYASSALSALIQRGGYKTPQEAVDTAFNFALGAVTRHRAIVTAAE